MKRFSRLSPFSSCHACRGNGTTPWLAVLPGIENLRGEIGVIPELGVCSSRPCSREVVAGRHSITGMDGNAR
jgi:hypothetical protein